jgi:hypothetical protein
MAETPRDRPLRPDAAAEQYFGPDSVITGRSLASSMRKRDRGDPTALQGVKLRGKWHTTIRDLEAWVDRSRVQVPPPLHPAASNIAPPATAEASAALARAHHAIEKLVADSDRRSAALERRPRSQN